MKWNSIETFFLDLDGTLLDLAYDNYFWHEHIPNIYAKKNNIDLKQAKYEFEKKYRQKKNTLDWYSLDYWSKKIGIDLEHEVLNTKNRIKVFPGTINFLTNLKKHNIKIILLTNCPRNMLNIKITQVKLWGYFDEIISSEDYGFSKETKNFWQYLDKKLTYCKNKTVFIDDNQDVLKCSYNNNIKNIFCINFPDSNKSKQNVNNFRSLDNIDCFEKKIIC